MYDTSLLPEELTKFSYYRNKLPYYLQNSNGFLSHFRMWFDLMMGKNKFTGIARAGNTILWLLNIFDPDYYEQLKTLPNYTSTKCDMLDKIGELYGVSRVFNATINIEGQSTSTMTLSLNNKEFLLLIRCQILRNYFDGSREDLVKFYEDVNLRMIYKTESSGTICSVYLAGMSGEYSQNTIRMFGAGLLTVESLGIIYKKYSVQVTGTLIWDETNWDVGEWST